MQLGSSTRRIVLFVFVLLVLAAATWAIRRRGENHKASSAPVASAAPTVTQPTVAVPVIQPDLPLATSSSEEQGAFAAVAETEVSKLLPGITLDQWMNLRGKNEGWAASSDENFFDCRTFERTDTLPSGRQITRMAYFYPPEAPSSAVFPTSSGQELINRTCTLAMVRIQTPTPAEHDGRELAQVLQQHLTKKYGDSVGMKGAVFGGAAAWVGAARWKNDSEIVSAYNPTQAGYDRDDPSAGTVFAFARLPVVYEIEQNACCRLKAYCCRSIENAQFHRAVVIAGVDAALSGRMARLWDDVFRDGRGSTSQERTELHENMKWPQLLVPVLQDWLDAIKSLPPVRQAAGLYAADRLLAATYDIDASPLGDPKKPELRLALEKLGATFVFMELDGMYNYANNWLKQAQELDPLGPIGQMAVFISLARGQPLSLHKNEDIFHEVILDGESLLTKNPDPVIAAQIHFMIGDACSDIVALAGGAEPPEYFDPAKYQDESGSARAKALGHYRAGLALDGTSENAKDAWLQAWHLLAGLLPTTRYVYIYD
jgi:hypothetical protein